MAKLKAPLLSLGASGAIGKAIVFFPWKGLNVAREYVIPANPNTTPQQTQRGYVIDCVALIHGVEAAAVGPLAALDKMAYALLGSLKPTPRTWFNTIVKQWIDQKILGLIPAIWAGFTITAGDTTLTVLGSGTPESSAPTGGFLKYGVSKTNLSSSLACTVAELSVGKLIPGLTNGTKYYIQYRPSTPVTFLGTDSGIYYGTPT